VSWYYVLWSLGCGLGAATSWLLFRARGGPAVRGAVVIATAVAGFVWGATLQFRLAFWHLGDAFLFSPTDVFVWGHMLPLGIVVGGAFAAATALALRVPWLCMADALAIGACVMMAAGRFGCVVAGCCTGSVCGRYLTPFCIRYGPGSEPYEWQQLAQIIPPSAELSLPVHPLPFYFIATSAMMAVVLFGIMRRSAKPGLAAAVFAVVYPAVTLLLEQVRGLRGGREVRLAVPAITLLASCVWLAVRYLIRWWGDPADRRRPGRVSDLSNSLRRAKQE